MKRLSVIIMLLVITGANLNAQKKELRYNLEEGKTYGLNVLTKININQQVMGNNMDIAIENSVDVSHLVTDESADGYEMEVKYTDLNIDMDMPGVDESAITGMNENMAKMTELIKSEPLDLTMSYKGVFGNLDNFDRLADTIAARISGEPDMVIQQIRSELASRKDNMNASYKRLPEKAVAPGDTWQTVDTIKSSSGMGIIMNTLGKLEAETDSSYIITLVSEVATSEEPVINPRLGETIYKMRGKSTVSTEYDKKTLWFLTSEIELNLEGVLQVMPGNTIPNGMDIPMKMKTNTEIEGYLPN